ncbi:MAG: hypothetical protein NC343_08515 [Muribaculum sp.]|nr:hypothetical protein [Muribaculaceae bacterium]MCM1081778.1 hypothetical protein [Muribaculum sp.]
MNLARIIAGITRRLSPIFPDKLYLSIIYRCKMGHWIDWKNPQTFTEKIQWLKLYNRRPEYTDMVDKYAVKKLVAEKIGEEYVIPTLGVWNSVNDIDLDSLPDKFVLKTTHGGGGGGVVICRDKASFNFDEAKIKLKQSLKADIYKSLREWPYKNVPRRIIAEQFIELPSIADLTDYKIYCFNGKPTYIQVIQNRNTNETIDFFDTDWNHQEFYGLNPVPKPAKGPVPKPAKGPVPKPANLSDMLFVAGKLAMDTQFVRVDLYQTDSGIYFGELTFFPASGIGTFTPEYWNGRLGDLLSLEPALGGVNI